MVNTNLTRRGVIRTAVAPFVIPRALAAPEQPNLLLIIGDDHTHHDIGCFGSNVVATPNIDRLAAGGVRFTRAFTGTAMCAPMRQQMMTGIFPVRNGAYPNHSQIKPGIKTWPSHFKELGYRVGLVGKRHFGPLEAFPYEYLGAPAGNLKLDLLEEFVRRNDRQPYCVFVASHEPHAPHNQGDPSRHPVSSIRVPPYWVDTPATREILAKYYAEVEYLDWQVGQCLDIVQRSGQANRTLTMYCSEQGNGLPFSKWTCYDLGLRESVVLRWPGQIRPGTTNNAMVQGVDWLPTLLEAAGGKAPAGIDGRSFLPVLLGKSDRHAEAVFGVHTTRGIINGSACYPIRSIRTATHKLILNLNHTARFQCAVQGEQENYWDSWVERAKTDAHARRAVERFERRPAVEFYEVARDPYEQRNLAAEPAQAARIESMTARLRDWMRQQGDRGVETEMLVKPHPRGEA
ncbi:MAG: sulfatase [Acidobacteria bacterium]|nr:sulfatase [Acidobacteriota bacterium]